MTETDGWKWGVEKDIEDDKPPRIEVVNLDVLEGYGLDTQMVGLATGLEHKSSKIALARLLSKQSDAHLELRRQRGTKQYLRPDKGGGD